MNIIYSCALLTKIMTQIMNYINALPDFLAMQRVSFCWFITQGLNEELTLFSKIYDFSQNTEYIMFGGEYRLIKPPYSLSVARKYSGNYRAQLVIPIEVRNKISNNICYQSQFPIITLPVGCLPLHSLQVLLFGQFLAL